MKTNGVQRNKLRMLVDRLAYHLCINAAQNGGFETFFSERFYQDDSELYAHIKKSDDYKTARRIINRWLEKVEA